MIQSLDSLNLNFSALSFGIQKRGVNGRYHPQKKKNRLQMQAMEQPVQQVTVFSHVFLQEEPSLQTPGQVILVYLFHIRHLRHRHIQQLLSQPKVDYLDFSRLEDRLVQVSISGYRQSNANIARDLSPKFCLPLEISFVD